jgi:hypothetical protein
LELELGGKFFAIEALRELRFPVEQDGCSRRSVRWRSNGFASDFAVGRSASLMTTRSTYAHDARRPQTQLATPAVELQWKNVAGFLKIAINEA